jgi:glycosyltransferase involved in cell wall biosynthesis
MRIGIMLRTLDEMFGIGMYTQYMLDALLELESNNQYILFYKNEAHLGKYAHYPNVEETVVKAPNKLLWDQVAIPLAARKAKVDVLFHTKFTVPFLTKCKTVMRIAGASWFVHPEIYPNKIDLTYIKMAMPLYCRKADALIANSKLTKNDFIKILHVPREKIRVVYNGVNPRFRPIGDPEVLDEVKRRYNLPDRFVLTVGRYDPRKNFPTIFRAFTKCRDAGALKLVAVGKDSWKYKEDCRIDESEFKDDFVFPGYVGHDDLPAFYNLAEAFIFPSIYEEFGNPLVEAMSCGCPIVASNTGAIPEITAGAAVLTEPFDADKLAEGVDQITQDAGFRRTLIEKGLQRAKKFSYENVAKEVLDVLEEDGHCG